MKKFSTSTIRATALLVATSGAAAATVLTNRPAPAPDRSTMVGIKRLAGVLGDNPFNVDLGSIPVPGPTTPLSFTAPARKQRVTTPAHFWHPPVLPAVDSNRSARAKSGETKAVTTPAVPFSPVANVALLGVTERGGVETAWLVDTQNGQRELVGEGERAHGLTVKQIGPDSVTLSGDGKQYTLRLGEKRIETASASSENSTVAENAAPAPASGWGNGGPSRRGGRNRGGNFGGGNVAGGSIGGGSFGGGNFGNRSAMGGNYGFGRAARQMASAAVGGNSGFARGNGNGSASMTSAFSSQSTAPTSNPQTARRENTRLIGGEAAIPVPTALANPQTTRRTGSNSNTPAFGQASGTVGSALSQYGPNGNGRATRQAPVQ